MLWPRAAKKSGNWHRGIVDAVDRVMMEWRRGEAEKELATPHSRRRQEQQPREAREAGRGEKPCRYNSFMWMNAETMWQIVWEGTVGPIELSVCYFYSPDPSQRVVLIVSASFVFVEFNGREHESDSSSNDLLSSFPFFVFFFL